MASKKSSAVVNPNLGLRFDRPAIALDPRELQDGLNFRISAGKLTNFNLGWTDFEDIQLNGPVRMIANFFLRSGAEHLIFATETDLYRFNAADSTVRFLTPIYSTGTVAVAGTAVTGTGTNWDPNLNAGDQISFGDAAEDDPEATWFTIQTRNSDTSLTLTATGGTIGAGSPYTARRLFSGDSDDIWQHATFVNDAGVEDRFYVTNGVDPLCYWNGTSGFATRLDSFLVTRIKTICVYKNMMIYGNFEFGGTNYATSIINSDVGDAQDVSTGLSEQFVVHDGTSGLLRVAVMADIMVLYSQRVITTAQFIGDPLIFAFRIASTGIGPLSPNAIADFGDYHMFVGFDTQYKFDGVIINEEGQHVWREIIRVNDPVRRLSVYSHFDEEQGELIWSIPLTTDDSSGTMGEPPDRAFVVHYLENVDPGSPLPYSQREFPFTATGYFQQESGTTWDVLAAWDTLGFRWNDQALSAAFPLNLVGDFDGYIYTLNSAQDKADGSALTSFVRFGERALSDGRMRGLVRRVYPFVENFENPLDVTVRLKDSAAAEYTDFETVSFDQTTPEGGHFATIFRRCRFFTPEFGTDGPGAPWVLWGFDVDVDSGGFR